MCGIYGTTKSYTVDQIEKKLARTSFRGPDQTGWKTYKNTTGPITFGHNRLSIIDLDPRSNQPFTYNDDIHLVFNGEIYNYLNIKTVLQNKGYSFRTTSDTEVICAAYLEYGKDCVGHFNGMFAFVIYDEKKQLLFGAKDRVGQKPLYYSIQGSKFEFASQISSIQLFNDKLSISGKSIEEYLSWNYMPAPDTIFNEIKMLRDGHWFTYDLNDHSFNTHQYWDIDYKGLNRYDKSFEEAQDDLEKTLGDAVKIRLHADVPVGVFLSGGVDSSLIAALAKKNKAEQIKTFAVKFREKDFDESRYAKMVADHLDTDHHEIECDYREGIELVENFSHFYDEPFADPSAIPSMLLAKYTKNHVTVALSGDGGDENFIGYHRYEWVARNSKYMAIPKSIRTLISKTLTSVSKSNRARVLANLISKENIELAYLRTMVNSDAPWMENSLSVNYDELKYLLHSRKNIYERVTDFDIKTYLSGDINTKVDRASMAYSLEARSPLLDYRVIELARSLPTKFKYKDKIQKRILKEVLYKHVPSEIFNRRKSGFGVPLRVWFREDLRNYVLDHLSEKKLKDIPGINSNVVTRNIQEHLDGKWDHYMLIWRLLVLSQWISKNGQGITIK